MLCEWHGTVCADESHFSFECTGHTDSVTQVAFNGAGTKLATADMSGAVKIWSVAVGESGVVTIQLANDLNVGADLEWLLWHSKADIVLAGEC